MNNSLRGAFLSGLVFPGLGQVVLKHYKRGIVLMLVFSVSLLVIVVEAVQEASAILEKIESEGVALDMSAISNAATQASTTPKGLIFSLLTLLLTCCWLMGVVDAYRIGRKKDIEERLTSEASSGNGN